MMGDGNAVWFSNMIKRLAAEMIALRLIVMVFKIHIYSGWLHVY